MSSSLKTSLYPHIVQRFRGPQTASSGIWEATWEALEPHKECADEVWFSTGIGYPSLAWHREHSSRLARAAEKCRSAGVLPGLEIQAVIGHGDSLVVFQDDCSGKNWGGWVGRDGTEALYCNCPRQPGLHDYMVELCRIYASWKPSSIWLDDDFSTRGRSSDPGNYHEPFGHGCFCSRCLKGFCEREGLGLLSREEFVKALDEDIELTDRWIDYTYDGLCDLAYEMAKAVHEVSPETRMGYQHGHQTCTTRQLRIYEALYKATGLPVGSRPGGGTYTDYWPLGILEKIYCEGAQMRAIGMPPWISPVYPEIENAPRNFSCKTVRGMETEALLALGAGMDGLSFFAVDATLERPEWYRENIFAPLAKSAPFFHEYIRLSKGTKPAGLAQMAYDICDVTDAISGFPIMPGPGKGFGCYLMRCAAHKLSRSELYALFRNGVIMDGETASVLMTRGFGDMLGGLRVHQIKGAVRENFTDDPLNEGLRSGQHSSGSWSFGFTALDAATFRVLGHCHDYRGNLLGDTTILVETADRLKYALCGCGGLRGGSLSSGRILQLGRIADWVSGGRLPALIETGAVVSIMPRVDDDGKLASVVICNTRIDDLNGCKVRLRNVPDGAKLIWRLPGEEDVVLPAQSDESSPDIVVTLPTVAPWRTGYIYVNNP